MSELISTIGLKKRFGRLFAVDGLDLHLEEGSVFGFIGPNGSGKTTTIKILMNLIQPSDGRATVLGVDSRRLGPEQFQQIGYISENQETPDWMTTDYLLGYLKPFYPTWDPARAAELQKILNLPSDRKLIQLSRGMKMKAMLASSLAYRPRLLVLDEPFTGLDAMVREDLIEALVDSARDTTILISSHDLADIESFASHIGYLDSGRLLISEDMTSLTARFREVEVTVNGTASLPEPPHWPAHWLRPQASGAVARFVETRFDEVKTRAEIQRTFRDALQVSIDPMPLRSIFVTLARCKPETAKV